ncbi:dynamin GTPase [Fusarium globosum]|uniref:Dynamin GTPase n=1 Tax=Fusarium globosum TaxID=78864 RepID=A0A8H5YZ28_9HYPO|nr:dynamin GTPase [Fusarium globosum]
MLDQINSFLRDQASLFDAVDSLRRFGVEFGIEVPQLIVIGDQNSGKSSVLEAISGCHFAIHHDLCTRFPIELALRKSDSTVIDVKAFIVPSTTIKRAAEEVQRIKDFKPSSGQTTEVQNIIKEAEEVIGISPDGGRQFSDDVLQISLTGPNLYPITLVDLPGLYRAKSPEQGEEGIAFVRELVEKYVKNEQSIILAVVSASSDPATQESHHLAQKHDKKQERTLGIITRPDTVDIGPETERIITLATSGSSILKKGWHTVRNLSAREREKVKALDETEKSRARDEKEEKFLSAGAWGKVSRDVKGIKALRDKLRLLLMDKVRTNLPELINTVRQQRQSRLMQLTTYVKPRRTPEDQRAFLVPMAQEFVRLANAAISGSYEDNFFGKPGDRTPATQHTRLRAIVIEMSRLFDAVFIACGRRIDLDDEDDDEDDIATTYSNVANNASELEEIFAKGCQVSASDQSLSFFRDISSSVLHENELRRYLVHEKPILKGHEGPGDTNSALARAFFRLQSDTWPRLVEYHYEAVLSAVRAFVHAVIQVVVPQLVRPELIHHIIEPGFQGLQQRFKSKCMEIVHGFQQVDPAQSVRYTDRDEFNKDVEKILQHSQIQDPQEPPNVKSTTDSNDGPDQIHIISGIRSWVLATDCRRVIRDGLLTSIEVLAVEACIRQVPHLFSPEELMDLSPEKLERAVGETNNDREIRKGLEKDISDLEEVKSTFENYISVQIGELRTANRI